MWHSVEIFPGPNSPKISLGEKINPVWWFGNADDPVPPEWFHPHSKFRGLLWRLRNPFHNFNCYVIGIADKTFVRSGRYPEKIANPHGGWNFAVSKYKCWRLPFLSYHKGKFDFYIGWRNHGNFGIKVNHNPRREGRAGEIRPPQDHSSPPSPREALDEP